MTRTAGVLHGTQGDRYGVLENGTQGDRNMLEQEYLTAKEFPGSIRISRNFTFYNGKSGFGILLNRKISNAVTHSKRHGNRIHHYLRIDNERGELYDDIRIPSASSGETILDYLKSICPQIGAKDYEPYTYDAQRLADVFANPDSAAFGDAPDDKQYRVSFSNYQSFNGEKCMAENIKSEVKTTDDGYVVACAMKWTDLAPKADDMIGLELQVNDAGNDGVRKGTLSWADDTGTCYMNPSMFGHAKLVE